MNKIKTLFLFLALTAFLFLHVQVKAAPESYDVGRASNSLGVLRPSITIGDYGDFLNTVALSDPHHLYEIKMSDGSVVSNFISRSGEPGSYHYEISDQKKLAPMTFINWCDAARYCNWRENTTNPTTSLKTDAEITEYGVYELDDDILVTNHAKATVALAENEGTFDHQLKLSGVHFDLKNNLVTQDSSGQNSHDGYFTSETVFLGLLAILGLGAAGKYSHDVTKERGENVELLRHQLSPDSQKTFDAILLEHASPPLAHNAVDIGPIIRPQIKQPLSLAGFKAIGEQVRKARTTAVVDFDPHYPLIRHRSWFGPAHIEAADFSELGSPKSKALVDDFINVLGNLSYHFAADEGEARVTGLTPDMIARTFDRIKADQWNKNKLIALMQERIDLLLQGNSQRIDQETVDLGKQLRAFAIPDKFISQEPDDNATWTHESLLTEKEIEAFFEYYKNGGEDEVEEPAEKEIREEIEVTAQPATPGTAQRNSASDEIKEELEDLSPPPPIAASTKEQPKTPSSAADSKIISTKNNSQSRKSSKKGKNKNQSTNSAAANTPSKKDAKGNATKGTPSTANQVTKGSAARTPSKKAVEDNAAKDTSTEVTSSTSTAATEWELPPQGIMMTVDLATADPKPKLVISPATIAKIEPHLAEQIRSVADYCSAIESHLKAMELASDEAPDAVLPEVTGVRNLPFYPRFQIQTELATAYLRLASYRRSGALEKKANQALAIASQKQAIKYLQQVSKYQDQAVGEDQINLTFVRNLAIVHYQLAHDQIKIANAIMEENVGRPHPGSLLFQNGDGSVSSVISYRLKALNLFKECKEKGGQLASQDKEAWRQVNEAMAWYRTARAAEKAFGYAEAIWQQDSLDVSHPSLVSRVKRIVRSFWKTDNHVLSHWSDLQRDQEIVARYYQQLAEACQKNNQPDMILFRRAATRHSSLISQYCQGELSKENFHALKDIIPERMPEIVKLDLLNKELNELAEGSVNDPIDHDDDTYRIYLLLSDFRIVQEKLIKSLGDVQQSTFVSKYREAISEMEKLIKVAKMILVEPTLEKKEALTQLFGFQKRLATKLFNLANSYDIYQRQNTPRSCFDILKKRIQIDRDRVTAANDLVGLVEKKVKAPADVQSMWQELIAYQNNLLRQYELLDSLGEEASERPINLTARNLFKQTQKESNIIISKYKRLIDALEKQIKLKSSKGLATQQKKGGSLLSNTVAAATGFEEYDDQAKNEHSLLSSTHVLESKVLDERSLAAAKRDVCSLQKDVVDFARSSIGNTMASVIDYYQNELSIKLYPLLVKKAEDIAVLVGKAIAAKNRSSRLNEERDIEYDIYSRAVAAQIRLFDVQDENYFDAIVRLSTSTSFLGRCIDRCAFWRPRKSDLKVPAPSAEEQFHRSFAMAYELLAEDAQKIRFLSSLDEDLLSQSEKLRKSLTIDPLLKKAREEVMSYKRRLLAKKMDIIDDAYKIDSDFCGWPYKVPTRFRLVDDGKGGAPKIEWLSRTDRDELALLEQHISKAQALIKAHEVVAMAPVGSNERNLLEHILQERKKLIVQGGPGEKENIYVFIWKSMSHVMEEIMITEDRIPAHSLKEALAKLNDLYCRFLEAFNENNNMNSSWKKAIAAQEALVVLIKKENEEKKAVEKREEAVAQQFTCLKEKLATHVTPLQDKVEEYRAQERHALAVAYQNKAKKIKLDIQRNALKELLQSDRALKAAQRAYDGGAKKMYDLAKSYADALYAALAR